MSTFRGTGHDDTLTGSGNNDNFLLWQGGNDTVDAGDGNDIFRMGGALNAGDSLNGGAGDDAVVLNGDYSAGVVFGADTITNVEVLSLARGHSYNLTTNDGNIAAGARLLVKAGSLGAGNGLTLDGSAETDGKFYVIAGAGNDTLTGGAKHDVFDLSHGGNDTVHGGGGNDLFVMRAAFTSGDTIDGGTGTNTLSLDGDYSSISLVGSGTIDNIQTVTFAGGHSYTGIQVFDDVAGGGTLTLDATALQSGDAFGLDANASTNAIHLMAGDGSYTVTGSAQGDTFDMGAHFTASDSIDGGAGNDKLDLDGDYSGANALAFGATTMVNVETLFFEAGHNYEVTAHDANVASGQTLTVDAGELDAGDTLSFDGSAETDGSFNFIGGAGDDALTGGNENDTFALFAGGNDTAHGGGGNDTFSFGDTFTAADTVDGSAGSDTISLNGDYSAGLTFGAATMVSVEAITVANGHSYNLVLDDANVAGGQVLSVNAAALTAGNALTFDGSAETDGSFFLYTGAGDDVVSGGQLADMFVLSATGGPGGTDTVHGSGGGDVIVAGATLDASDVIDGGAGTDTLNLQGDYSGGLNLGPTTLAGIETLLVSTGNIFVSYSYNLTSDDGNVAAGQTLAVDASGLVSTETLTFNGSAETNGSFAFTGGAGNDVLTGGAQNDSFNLAQGGNDTANGGVGNDTFSFGAAFTASDTVDGGAGNDTLELNGPYGAGGITFGSGTLASIETIVVDTGGIVSHFYELTSDDGNVAAGQTLAVDGSSLSLSERLTFDGSAETDGSFAFTGGAGDDNLFGGELNDTFDLTHGGNDSAQGDEGSDTFLFGATFTAADRVDGGSGSPGTGTADAVTLSGDYSAGVTFAATTMTNIATLNLLGAFDYNLTTNDATVSAGQLLTVNAGSLGAGHALTFDGSAETDGSFLIVGSAGPDVLTGGAQADTFTLTLGGGDTVHGGGGGDTIQFLSTSGFSASETLDGGSGNDTLVLQGGGTFVMAATTISSIETIDFVTGSYNFTTVDANVAAGAVLTVNAVTVGAGHSLTFDGSAETNGRFAFQGSAGDDVLTGGAQNDTYNVTNAGNDTLVGGGGNDTFSFGATFTATDSVDGGTGNDSLTLNGDYSGGVTFGAATMAGIENLSLTGANSYNLVLNDANVAAGQSLYVDASGLTTGHAVTFDGSAETDGSFAIYAGAGDDVLSGGAQGDTFSLQPGTFLDYGTDTVHGNGGDDMIFAGKSLGATDVIDGGAGNDTLQLSGSYAGLTMGSGTLSSIETLVTGTGGGIFVYSYNLASNDGNVAAGQTLTVDGSSLLSTETLTFNGSAETNGHFSFIGGAGNEVLTGGALADTFDLSHGGNDTAHGGGGADTFSFGGTFTASDTVDGGTGTNLLDLGAGTTATLSSTAVTNIQTVGMATNDAYNLTVTGDIAGGARLKFDAGSTFDVKTIDVSGATSTGYDFVGGTGAMNVKFGGNFSLSDTFTLSGGPGAGQFGLEFHGNYSGGNALTFAAGTISDLTNLKVDDGFDYNITLNAANVSNALGTVTIDAQSITSHNVTFDMSTANADAFFHGGGSNTGVDNVHTGSGNDTLWGGAGDDILNAGTGNANIDGYLGQDIVTVDASGTQLFQFAHANESSGTAHDIVHGLNFTNADFQIGLGAGVTAIDAAITHGTLSAANFDTDLANDVSTLGNHHAVLFTANAGDLAGHTFLVVEQNGGTGYVSGFDLVVEVTGFTGTLTTGDFI